MDKKLIAFTTCADSGQATALARELVARKLAACVQTIPGIRSFYRWKGAIEHDDEVLLIIKTTVQARAALEAAVLELHSYETPEFIAIEAAAGSAAYMDWIAAQVEA